MCVQINSRCVLLNILQVRESTDLSDLVRFAVAFKGKVHDAYVDISDASVFSVLENNTDIFELTGRTVTRTDKFAKFENREFLDMTINRHLPPNVRKSLHECADSMRT
jgi:hypothetical protein